MIYAVLQCNKNLYLFLEKSWSYEVGKVCLFEEYVLLLFCNFSTKPWQFLLVSFVKGHLSPQVHEWCVKALLPCEQTCERRFCPHGTCQGGQVLTQSLTLKSAQLKSQHSPATHGEGGSAHLRLLHGDNFLPSYLQTFGHTCRSHSGKHCLHPLICPGPWSAIRDLRKWEYDKGWVEMWCVWIK